MSRRALTWVGIAFLFCSVRLFESGISLDPALFAAVARNFARTWKWWSFSAGPYLFPEYFEHPFLPIWIQGIVFHFFGANDFTARLVGLAFGCGTFYYLYRVAEEIVNERFAAIYCFLTLFSVYFTGRIPTFYYDVSLFYFLSGLLFYSVRALSSQRPKDGVLAGLMLAGAFLCKGIAVAPMVATILVFAGFRLRANVFRSIPLWVCTLVSVGILAVVFSLQKKFGSYPFLEKYLATTLFHKTLRPGGGVINVGQMKKLFETHAIHAVLAIVGLYFPRGRKELLEARVLGVVGSLFFVGATNNLTYSHLHYFYVIYPMINFLSAAAVYGWVREGSEFSWTKLAFRIAIIYAFLWHVLPLPMRRKGVVDFLQTKGLMAELRRAGAKSIDAWGIDKHDWIYRELSLWYWEIDSRMLEATGSPTAEIVVIAQEAGDLQKRSLQSGFHWCQGTPRYAFFVKLAANEGICRRAGLAADIIR